MSREELALFFHLFGVICFFSGLAIATSGAVGAWGHQSPAAIAALLRLARVGALLVVAGLVVVLGFGLWLLDLTEHDLGDGWVIASLALLALATVLGAVGGQRPKRARLLAEQEARAGAAPSPELQALVRDRVSMAINGAAALAALAILVLMVWKPGS